MLRIFNWPGMPLALATATVTFALVRCLRPEITAGTIQLNWFTLAAAAASVFAAELAYTVHHRQVPLPGFLTGFTGAYFLFAAGLWLKYPSSTGGEVLAAAWNCLKPIGVMLIVATLMFYVIHFLQRNNRRV